MAVPAAPILTAQHRGNGVVRLKISTVTATPAVTGYGIFRDDAPDAVDALDLVAEPGIHYDATVADGVLYYYRVTAVNSDGDSDYSNEVAVLVSSAKAVHPTNAQRLNRRF